MALSKTYYTSGGVELGILVYMDSGYGCHVVTSMPSAHWLP